MLKPTGYRPPDWQSVSLARNEIHDRYRGYFEVVAEMKRMRKHAYTDVLVDLPEDYADAAAPYALTGFPVLGDYLDRIKGMIAQHEPKAVVAATEPNRDAWKNAAEEEKCLNAIRVMLERSQSRGTFSRALDAQVAFGLSWISLMPDTWAVKQMGEWKRKDGEDADEYMERMRDGLKGRVPLIMRDHDPETVLPFFSDREELTAVVVVTLHSLLDVEMKMGYRRVGNAKDGYGWEGTDGTLFEGTVAPDIGGATESKSVGDSTTGSARTWVEKVTWCDRWYTRTWLDGTLVDEWEHDAGLVPFVPAYGVEGAERDPAFANRGIGYNALPVAQLYAKWMAWVASVARTYAAPTIVGRGDISGQGDGTSAELELPAGRATIWNEDVVKEILAPFTNVQTPVDLRAMLTILDQFIQSVTISDFGRAISGGDLSGYAVVSLQNIQASLLKPIYTSLRRQWEQVFELMRAWIRKCFPDGVRIHGGIEEKVGPDGERMKIRQLIEYGEKQITLNPIEVEIKEGIPQDVMARDQLLMTKHREGFLSLHTTMELMETENVQAEIEEIERDNLRRAPETIAAIVNLALGKVGVRGEAMEQAQNTPARQALQQAMTTYLGGQGGAGNGGPFPANAPTGGVPENQGPGRTNPGGGQMSGPHLPSVGGPQRTPSGGGGMP